MWMPDCLFTFERQATSSATSRETCFWRSLSRQEEVTCLCMALMHHLHFCDSVHPQMTRLHDLLKTFHRQLKFVPINERRHYLRPPSHARAPFTCNGPRIPTGCFDCISTVTACKACTFSDQTAVHCQRAGFPAENHTSPPGRLNFRRVHTRHSRPTSSAVRKGSTSEES